MFQPRNRPDRANRRPVRRQLSLEALEDRTLMSASPTTVLDLNGVSVNPNQYSSTDILVRFQTPPGSTGGPALVAGTTLGAALPLVSDLYQVNLSPGTTVAQALAAYKAESGVISAEPDYDLTVSMVPNDPLLSKQWNLHNTGQTAGTPGADIHAQQAWDVSNGSPNIIVAVMDTGIDYNHPDLYQNIWINQAEIPNSWYTKSSATSGYNKLVYKSQIQTATPGIITFRDLNNPVNRGLVWDNNGDGRIDAGDLLRPVSQGGWQSGSAKDGDTAHRDDLFGWNFVNNTNNPLDDNGHGTNVAGILGATGDNGLGVAGVDWNVQIMPIKFIGSNGNGAISAFIQGLNYAVQHGAKITNNSWEGAPYSQALSDAVNNARLHGQIFVAAAGNEGANDDSVADFPASFSRSLNNVVAVAATDANDRLASFSNYGVNSVALAAPGVNIYSTASNGQYGAMSGTSQAAPQVAATLALVWGLHPSWSYSQVINQVLSTVDRLPSLQGKLSTGGRLDVAAAVGWNLSTRVTPTVTSLTTQGVTSNSMNSLWLTFNEPINVSTFTASAIHLTDTNGRNIPVIVRVVANSSDRQMVLLFSNQTAPGAYKFSIDSTVRDLQGNRMAPFQRTITLQGPQTYTNATAVAIGARGTATSTITVPAGTNIGKLQVRLNISDPYDGALNITLTAPNGRTVQLVSRRGDAGDNFVNTVLDDYASASIAQGKAPYTGTFRGDGNLRVLNGMSAGGTWRLTVQNVGPYTGKILNWSLLVTPDSVVPVVTTSSVQTASVETPAPAASSPTVSTVTPSESPSVSGSSADAGSISSLVASLPAEINRGTPAPADPVFTSPSILAQIWFALFSGKRPTNGLTS
jgi:subtilisin family serine protease